jgi:serine/threonine-protein kinase RsbW
MENVYTQNVNQINFSSKVENLSLVEKFIDNVCEQNKVNQDFYGNILIALTEAVNNAIFHGNSSDPLKNVTVSCKQNDKGLAFFVEDQGKGFDYDTLPDPTDPDNIEKPNGRGVFLMKNLADQVQFHDNGRKVEIVFKVSAN